MDKIYIDFGLFIKEKRLALGLTQQEVADKLHVSQNSYSRYETGERKATLTTVFALEKILDFKAGEFFDNYGNEN